MAMFIKLFATSMVAKSFLGLSNNFETIRNCLDSCSKPLSKSVLVKEKNATSAPEIRAEQSRRTNNSRIPIIKGRSNAKANNIKLEGSGSNFNLIS